MPGARPRSPQRERAAPLAKGEVAAFRVATEPESLAGLAFTDPEGKPVTLAALQGKTALVNVWATWCVPCRAEMPTLDRLQAEMGGDQFAVVPVNIDLNATERAKAFLDEIGVANLPFYSDPSGKLFQDLKRRGLAIGLPTTILVDGKGCRIGVVGRPGRVGLRRRQGPDQGGGGGVGARQPKDLQLMATPMPSYT